MIESDIRKYGTPYDIERREELQKVLFQLYEEDSKLNNTKKKIPRYTQSELGAKINVDQTTISRLLTGYKIDWFDEYKIKLKTSNDNNNKPDELSIDELFKNITITKPSTFFISVGQSKKKYLENFLLKHFRSSKDKIGIIHITNIKNPSGLLIFSDDHNLEYTLQDKAYIQQIMNDMETAKDDETSNH